MGLGLVRVSLLGAAGRYRQSYSGLAWCRARLCGALRPSGKKALLTSGDMAGLLCPPAVRTLPLSPPPFFPHPVFLIQAAISGGWRQSCVHYNSLG
eukprot:scaffold13651_cov149-Isochrysis_galbana.AAC.2